MPNQNKNLPQDNHTSVSPEQEVVGSFDASEGVVTYLDGDPIDVVDPLRSSGWEDEKLRELHAAQLRRRDEILRLPTDVGEVNIARVDKYTQELGMPLTALRIFDPQTFSQALAMSESIHDREPHGSYLVREDISIVSRNSELEVLNGPEIIESFAVHERAHSWGHKQHGWWPNMFNKVMSRLLGRSPSHALDINGFSRTDYNGVTKGRFLEEAYAEFERGQYVMNVLGRPRGLGDARKIGYRSPLDKYIVTTGVEQSRGWKDYNYTAYVGAAGAAIFEQLIAYDPGVLTLLRGCRKSPDLIPQLASRVNEIVPGLWDRLDNFDNMQPEGKKQVNDLVDELLNGRIGIPMRFRE